jgi:hypothetical protein
MINPESARIRQNPPTTPYRCCQAPRTRRRILTGTPAASLFPALSLRGSAEIRRAGRPFRRPVTLKNKLFVRCFQHSPRPPTPVPRPPGDDSGRRVRRVLIGAPDRAKRGRATRATPRPLPTAMRLAPQSHQPAPNAVTGSQNGSEAPPKNNSDRHDSQPR